MTVAQLRTFLAVVDHGSVRDAARHLVISESAVSAGVSALTRTVGTPLYARRGRGLVITAGGLAYATYARQVLGLLSEGAAAARAGADPEHGTVRVAAVTAAAEHLLPVPLAAFRRAHPGVDVRLQVQDSRRVWTAFAAHEVDLVLAGRPPDELAGAVVRGVRDSRLLVVGAPELAKGATHAPGRATWLLRESGSGTRATLEGLLQAAQLDPPVLLMGSSGAVVAGAVAGLGLALVAEDAVRRQLRAGEVVELRLLPGAPLQRPWRLVTHLEPPATARLLVDALLGAAGSPWRAPDSSSAYAAASTGRGRRGGTAGS